MWRDGNLSLISSGEEGADDALYRGADRDAANVYLSTRDALTWQDRDEVLDVYAARVGGGFDEPPPPSVCEVLVDVCQPLGVGRPASSSIGTESPSSDGDAVPRVRKTLAVSGLSVRARRRASRRGVVALRVRASGPGRVRVLARARFGRVATGSVRLRTAGVATVRLRLSGRARRVLGRDRALRIRLRVTSVGARPRSMTVRLPEVKR